MNEEMKRLYDAVINDTSDVECDNIGEGIYKKTPFEERIVAVAYTTWHHPRRQWGEGTWDLPLYGPYCSSDADLIRYHGELFAKAGVDLVFVDWSNNTGYVPETMHDNLPNFAVIEDATGLLFDIWKDIPNAPKIAIFAGPGHNGPASVQSGEHDRKVEQIYREYVTNPERKDMYFHYRGKPLLLCYGATPNFYGADPEWDDDRFTVRWVTGYVGQQPDLYDKQTKKSHHFWSWEERGAQSFTVCDGTVEAVTISAATRPQGKPENSSYIPAALRDNGATFKKQFQRACNLGARIAVLVSWNEWVNGEQINAEQSKDLEPSQIHGTFYYDLMCAQIKKFKGKI